MTARPISVVTGPVDASVSVPGSKSIANRALVCAALADETTTLRNVPDGDDTAAMLAALRRLGLDVTLHGDTVAVGPVGDHWPTVTLHAGLAGTTSRFLTSLAALGSVPVVVDGDPPLRSRPFGPLQEALGELGVTLTHHEVPGHLPVTVTGPPSGRSVSIRGDVSSQFISALMMIGPRLSDGLEIRLTSTLVSRPYVELTAAVMRWFGVDRIEVGADLISVPAGSYRALDVAIEPDASSASYPLAVAALGAGKVHVPGLGLGSLQGDARFADLCGAMGAGVTRTTAGVTVEAAGTLRGIDVDMADVSDLVPTVAVMAALARTPTLAWTLKLFFS